MDIREMIGCRQERNRGKSLSQGLDALATPNKDLKANLAP